MNALRQSEDTKFKPTLKEKEFVTFFDQHSMHILKQLFNSATFTNIKLYKNSHKQKSIIVYIMTTNINIIDSQHGLRTQLFPSFSPEHQLTHNTIEN